MDISRKGIEKAHIGFYNKISFRGVESEYIEKYFISATKGYTLSPAVGKLVHFHCDNFIRPGFFENHKPYDIIFCRNLLIYLTEEARAILLKQIDRLLIPGGLLFTGHAELLYFQRNGYLPVDHPRSFACKKVEKTVFPEPMPKYENKTTFSNKDSNSEHAVIKTKLNVFTNPVSSGGLCEKEMIESGKMSSLIEEARKHADNGDLKEALVICEKCLDGGCTDAESYYLSGLIYNAMNELAMAEDFFHKALYLDPNHYNAVVHLCLIYEHKGDIKRSALMKKRAQRILDMETAMSVQNDEKQ